MTEPYTPRSPLSGIGRFASLFRQTSVVRYWRLGDSPALRLWRNRILVSLLRTVAILGFFACLLSIAIALRHGDLQIVILDTLAFGVLISLLAARRASYRKRAVGLLLVCYLIGLYFTWSFGPFAAGPLWLFATPVLAAILFGLPGATWALVATAVTVAFFGVALHLAVVPWHESISPEMWVVIIGSSFLTLASLLAISIAVLLHGLVDIHAQFEHEVKARKQVDQQLEQATRLDALGRLAGGVAHDFNNILTAILAYVELLKSRCGHDGEIINDLDGIGKTAGRAADLTRQLLAFSREQDICVAATDLNVLLGAVEGMLRRLIREDISLQIEPSDDTWWAFGDKTQLEQVIVNLVVNAVDAIPGQGKIIISTCNRTIDAEPAAAFSVESGDYVELTIEDTGTGMTEDVRLHVFDPFFTTKEVGKGTGLGLATVHGIIAKSGGGISVRSEVGRGTRFTVVLPRAPEALMAKADAGSPVRSGDEGILIVEDNSAVRILTARMLGSIGYKVWVASTPGEAETIARAHGDTIRLLLTDVIMPEMNGPELAQELKRHLPRAAVLFMSGYMGDVLKCHGIKPTDSTLIQKPFSRDELATTVRRVLDRGIE